MPENRCSCGEPLFEDPDTGLLHCLKPHDMVEGKPASEGHSRLMSEQRDALRELDDALKAAGMSEGQVTVSGDVATMRLRMEEAEELQRRIDYDVGTENTEELARELRVKLAYVEAALALARLAIETRNEHMETEMIREAEAVLDLDDEAPEEGATDGPP
jgi:hypothetical protein